MASIKGEMSPSASVVVTRPAILQNCLATERHLLKWMRTLFYVATFGLLMVSVVLYLWRERLAMEQHPTVGTWWLHTAGFALITLGSAVLVLGTVTEGIEIERWRGAKPLIIWSSIAAALGLMGFVAAGALLFGL